MVMNDKIKRDKLVELKDNMIKLKFQGEYINRTQELKYLGNYFSENQVNDYHINSLIKKTTKSSFKLSNVGYKSPEMNYLTKSSLCKTYLRPILTYGLENIYMRKKDISKIQTTEGNLIKNALGFSNRVKTTELLYAMNLEPINEKISTIKATFLIRLIKNQFTSALFESLNELYKINPNRNSFIHELKNITECESDEMREIIIASERTINKNKNSYLNSKKCDEKVLKLKELLNSKKNEQIMEIIRCF